MNKIEQYINYVVDDLVKDTEMDYTTQKITTPFIGGDEITFRQFYHIHKAPPYHLSIHPGYAKLIQTKYGAREEELDLIWDTYSNKIKSLIKK